MTVFRVKLGRQNIVRSVLVALAFLAFPWTMAHAETPRFWPQTTVRLTVVQWMPTKGIYERWEALGGEFVVSDDMVLSLPVIGRISVGNLDEVGLAQEITQQLKNKIGLVKVPEATVSIVKYPPVYLVGDVKSAGEYPFQSGLTVLQAMAMGGGEYRPDRDGGGTSGKSALITELRSLENSILRGEIRVRRLTAELMDPKDRHFDPPADKTDAKAMSIYTQEKAILTARADLLARQTKSFGELRELLFAEIKTLDKKTENSDADMASVAKELRNVKSMVEKGIALPSKQGDLERMLRSYSAARLDLSTAEMRARQGIAEASRNLEGLYDRQRTEITADLQAEQATLDQLQIKRDGAQKQLLRILSDDGAAEGAESEATISFSIDRRVNGRIERLTAQETTLLQPGDVVRFKRAQAPASATELPPADLVETGNSQ